MKILHTADWHLGKKLEQQERTREQQQFLDWLIDTLDSEKIDVLIVAGDIFDTGFPSNTAFEQYYNFLRRVKNTGCREVVIIGGNHDSTSTLNAPKSLLAYFQVHIIGGVPDRFEDQIVPIKNSAGEVELVICAVPFLRDKDIRLSVPGETMNERETRIKQGIANHYLQIAELVAEYKNAGIPVIATGHLFAAGATTSDSEKEIHVGNLGQVGGDHFPAVFDYVALGHIHKPQLIDKLQHVRYAGSPIPLGFSETNDAKQVVIIEFEGGLLTNIQTLELPNWRKLFRLKGTLKIVAQQLLLLDDPKSMFPAWVEVQVETDQFIDNLETELEQIRVLKPFVEKLFIRQVRTRVPQDLETQMDGPLNLSDLTPQEVFLQRCAAEFPNGEYGQLLETFEEALEKMRTAN